MGNKELGFSIRIDGINTEANEIAKLEFQLKNLKKEKQELLETSRKEGFLSNENKRALTAYNKEIGIQEASLKTLKRVVDTASDSLNRKKALLIQLKEQYGSASDAVAKKMAPAINKLNDEISKSEQAIGVHSRGVGSYKQSIIDAGKQLLGFGGVVAATIVVLNKLKDAFKQTEQGAKFFGKTTEIFKTLFQGIVSGDNIKEIFKNTILAANAADKLNQIRIDDRGELVEIARLETEIEKLRYRSVDATLSETEQLEALVKAQEKEDELIQFKIKDKTEEKNAIEELMKTRKNDTALLNQYYQLQAEIITIEGERNLRLESRATALREKIMKMSHESGMAMSEINGLVKYVAPGAGDIPAEIQAAQFIEDEKERIWQEGLQKARQNFAANKELAQEAANDLIDIELAKLDYKQEVADAEIAIAAGIGETLTQLAGKNKALAFTALAIEKGAAIAQIISNIAIANAKAVATSPLTFGQPWVALNTGIGAVSIAGVIAESIKAGRDISKYATGGKITGGIPFYTGTKDNRLIAVNETETVLTSRHVAALGGSGVMRRIGVPGYADGGYTGTQVPEIPAMGFDYSALARLINEKEVRLDVNKLNSAQSDLSIINQTQRI